MAALLIASSQLFFLHLTNRTGATGQLGASVEASSSLALRANLEESAPDPYDKSTPSARNSEKGS